MYRLIFGSCILAAAVLAFAGGEPSTRSSSDYTATLRSMVRDVALAPLEKQPLSFQAFRDKGSVAGITIGDPMNTVIAAWGPPRDLASMHKGKIWTHYYENASLLYHDYRLVRISLGEQSPIRFTFDNGISGRTTRAEAERLLGKFDRESHAGGGYVVADRVLSLTFGINGQFPKGPDEWQIAELKTLSIEGPSPVR